MPSRPPPRIDLWLGLALMLVGAACVAVASRSGAAAFHFVPALDGCLTVGVVGFGLALIEGVPYRQAVLLLAPIVAIQLFGAQVHHASWLALVGMEATAFGLVGALLGRRAPRAATWAV